MQTQLYNTHEFILQEYDRVEKLKTSYIGMLFNILPIKRRKILNFQAYINDVSTLFGPREDHTLTQDQVIGPPTRSLCHANSFSH